MKRVRDVCAIVLIALSVVAVGVADAYGVFDAPAREMRTISVPVPADRGCEAVRTSPTTLRVTCK
jgi:hypothetical protein